MSVVDAYYNKKKEDEEKKVVGQQQKTQSSANKPTGSTSIPKDKQEDSRTQKSAASSLRTENNTTTSGPRKEESKTNIIRRNTVTANKAEQRQNNQRTQTHGGNSGSMDASNRATNDRRRTSNLTREEYRDQRYNTTRMTHEMRNRTGNIMDTVNSLPDAPTTQNSRTRNLVSGKQFVGSNRQGMSQQEANDIERRIANIDGYGNATPNPMIDEFSNLDRYTPETKTTPWNQNLLTKDELSKGVKSVTPEIAKQWLDPNTELDEGAKQIAKAYAQQELDKFNYRGGHQPILNSEEDRQKYADLVNLINKTSGLASFNQAAVNPFMRLASPIVNTIGTDEMKQNVNEDWQTGLQNAQTQNPGLSTAGNIAGNAGLYALTNPVFDKIGAALGITSKAGQFAVEQAGQNLQDVALSTAPLAYEMKQQGKTEGEIQNAVNEDLALNALGNLVFGGVGELFKGLKGANNIPPVDTPEPQLIKNVTEQTVQPVKNVDDIVRNLPEEQILRNATDDPFNGIDEAIQPADINKSLGGNANDFSVNKDNAIRRLTDLGGDADIDAYRTLVNAADAEDLNAFNKAMSDYNATTGGKYQRQLNRLDDAVNGRLPETLTQENYRYINDNIDVIEDGLNRIGNLEGLSDLGKKHLGNAYDLLDQYETAIRNGGDAEKVAKDLNKSLGNLDNQAKKIDGYDGVFSKWKGANTARGDLYSNTGRINNLNRPLTAEEQAVVDSFGYESNYARPANQSQNVLESNPVANNDIIPDIPKADTDIPLVDETPKQKVSQTYTNTGKNGGGWNDVEYGKYTDPKDYLYETKSEADSVARAENMRNAEGRDAFKERVLKEERMSSEEIDGLMMEWRELTEEARQLEADGKDASSLWNESNRVFRKIREQSTNNAQALQALAKWSRNTPEGMLVEAENIVNGKVKVEKGELQKQLEKYLKKNHPDIEFSGEFEQQFLNLAEEFKKYDPDSREAKDLMGRIGRLVDSQVPKKLSQKVQTWLMDSMLGNFRTLISRNAGGNIGLAATEQLATRPLAAGIDTLVSAKTGRRTQAGLSKAAIGEYLDGMKKGLADELHDMKTGLHTARTGENTLKNAISSNQHVFKTKILDKFDSLVKNGLSMGDRPFYEATYAQTLGDYYRLRSQMGPDIAKLTDEQFKEYAETAAKLNSLAAVYQNDSKLAKGMLDLKNAIGQISEGTLGVDILSQFSMPFVKTPANVIDRAIDYSPIGFLRNAIRTGKEGGIGGANFDQNRFVNEAARNIIGSGITLGGAGLAYAGKMSGSYSEDADEKKAQQDAGMQEYALNVPEGVPFLGGNQVDIGWMPIVGSNLVAGAAAYDAAKDPKGSLLDNLFAGAAAGGNELFGQAAMQGAQRLFGGTNSYNKNEGIMENAKNVVSGGVSQAIPSIARQAAQVADPYKRDLGNSNEGNYELNQILNALPYFRQNYLVPKVDSSGNPVLESQGRDVASKILEDMILPGRVSEVQYNRLDEEAMALSEATGNKFSYMPKAVRKNVEDESRKLTNDEWYDYQVKYGQSMTEAGESMINNELYADMTPEDKEAALQDIYTAVKSSINSEYKERNLTGAAKVYANEGLDAAIDYVIYGNALTSAGLSNNEKNRGLLAENGIDYVNDLVSQKQQKDEINATNPEGNSTVTQTEILDYLNQNDFSDEEAQRIWDTYKNSNTKKTLEKVNDKWELSGGTTSKAKSNKTTNNKKNSDKKDSDLIMTGNATLDARIKAKANWKNNQQTVNTAKEKTDSELPSIQNTGSWTVEHNGKSYDLHSTKTYQRAQAAGWSDSDFLKHFHGADTDNSGTITKKENQAYINALEGLSKKEKHDMFEILQTRKAKNPY